MQIMQITVINYIQWFIPVDHKACDRIRTRLETDKTLHRTKLTVDDIISLLHSTLYNSYLQQHAPFTAQTNSLLRNRKSCNPHCCQCLGRIITYATKNMGTLH